LEVLPVKRESRFFKALADETRLQILALLSWGGELCVCDIMRVLGLTQSKASRHLRYLTQAGILEDERRGVWVNYRLLKQFPPLEERIIGGLQTHFEDPLYSDLKKRLSAWLAEKGDAPLCVCKTNSKKGGKR